MNAGIRQEGSAFRETTKREQLPRTRLDRRIAAALVCILGLAIVCEAHARPTEPDPTIRVRVINYTRATPATVAQAEREAARILSVAGLQTTWLDCRLRPATVVPEDPCLQPLEPNEIIVRILSDHTRAGFQDNAFGFAVAPLLASVYYEHAERLARIDAAKFEVPIILGCVMVHEIGHLLLDYNSHSDSGIMQSRWEAKQVRQLMIGGLTFTAQQSQRIREEARTRMSLQTARFVR